MLNEFLKPLQKPMTYVATGVVLTFASCSKGGDDAPEPAKQDKSITTTTAGVSVEQTSKILQSLGSNFKDNGVTKKVSVTPSSDAEANADISIVETDLITDASEVVSSDGFAEYISLNKTKAPNKVVITFRSNAKDTDKGGYKDVTLNMDATTRFSYDADNATNVATYATPAGRAALKADVKTVVGQVNTKPVFVQIW